MEDVKKEAMKLLRMMPIQHTPSQKLKVECKKASPEQVIQAVAKNVNIYAPYIAERNDEFFRTCPMLEEWDLKGLLILLDAETKETVYKELSGLCTICNTFSLMPPDMMKNVQDLAQQCAGKMEGGKMNPEVMNDMLKGVMSMMGGGGDSSQLMELFPQYLPPQPEQDVPVETVDRRKKFRDKLC